jgi:hypothetical protein
MSRQGSPIFSQHLLSPRSQCFVNLIPDGLREAGREFSSETLLSGSALVAVITLGHLGRMCNGNTFARSGRRDLQGAHWESGGRLCPALCASMCIPHFLGKNTQHS